MRHTHTANPAILITPKIWLHSDYDQWLSILWSQNITTISGIWSECELSTVFHYYGRPDDSRRTYVLLL